MSDIITIFLAARPGRLENSQHNLNVLHCSQHLLLSIRFWTGFNLADGTTKYSVTSLQWLFAFKAWPSVIHFEYFYGLDEICEMFHPRCKSSRKTQHTQTDNPLHCTGNKTCGTCASAIPHCAEISDFHPRF